MTAENAVEPGEIDPTMITSKAEFGAALTKLRERAGLTVRDVAKMIDVPHTTLGDYFAGTSLPSLKSADVLHRLLTACGVTGEAAHREWREALIKVRRVRVPPPPPAASPYRGLAPFEREDAEWFFGREELVRTLLERVRSRPRHPIVVAGSSGSGKSSLLRAGLLPALGDLRVAVTSPSSSDGTAREFGEGDEGGVLVIDQFEELFTPAVSEDERDHYLAQMLRVARRNTVVLGLRNDFLGQAALADTLKPALHQVLVIGSMTEDQLRAAITEPARRANVAIEPGLAELLIHDVLSDGDAAGRLPLLSHALRATWRRDPAGLTTATYQATGGIRGAVAQSADAVYESLSEPEQRLARRLFLRLVQVSDHVPDTRRRVPRTELPDGGNGRPIDEVLDRFIDQRLLTVDDNGVAITHEALVRAWPRLRAWLDLDRDELRTHHRLTEAARAWRDGDREPSILYRDGTLESAQEWAAEHNEDLNTIEREFLTASRLGQQHRQTAHRRQVFRLRALIATLVVLLVAAGSLAIVVQTQRKAAEHYRDLATSRQVAAQARLLRPVDRSLEEQLALAAYRIAPTPEATAGLLDLSTEPLVTRMPGANEVLQGAAVNPSGTLLAAGGTDRQVRLWNIADRAHPRQLGAPLDGPAGTVFATAFSPDGRLLAVAGADRLIRLWDVSDPATPVPAGLPLSGPENTVYSVAFSADGTLLAAGSADKTVRLWKLGGPGGTAPAGPPLTGATGFVQAVAFAGHLLAAGSVDHTVQLWDVSDPAHPVPSGAPLSGPRSGILAVTFSPDGRTLAAGSSDRGVYLWHVDDPAHPVADGAALTASTGWVNTVAFSPDGTLLAAGASDNQVRVWDLAARRVIQTLPHPGPVTATGFLGGSGTLFTAAADGTARLWTLPGGAITDPSGPVFSVAYPATGRRLAVSSGRADDSIELWDTTDLSRPAQTGVPVVSPAGRSPFSGATLLDRDGKLLVAGCQDGSVQLWDVADPAKPHLLADLPGDGALVESFALSPDERTLAVAGDDHNVRRWTIADPTAPVALPVLRGPDNYVYSVAFSPDGTTLAAGSADTKVWLWQVEDPAHPVPLPSLEGFRGYVYGVAFSPRDHLLAAGSADKTVRLWNMADPRHPAAVGEPITGPGNYVYGIAISPDGRTLAIGSTDASVRLVDITRPEAPRELAALTGATDAVYVVVFTPDGHGLVAGTAERRVRLWDIDPDEVAARVCATAGAGLTEAEWHRYVPDLPFRRNCP